MKYLALMLLLIGCSPEIRQFNKLVPGSPRQVKRNPHGAYILAFTSDGPVTGEYIGRNANSVFILTIKDARQIPLDSLTGFQLTLTRNRSRDYLQRTAGLMIPSLFGALIHNEWAGGFLFVAVVAGASGAVASLIESGRDSQVIAYPGDINDLALLDKYARFPGGIPEHIDPMDWVLEEALMK